MADIYLTRKSGKFVKYSNCTGVALTGQTASYSSTTGNAATDTLTTTGSAFLDGYSLTFTSLTGGAGLSTLVKYFVVSASGTSYKLATSQGGTPIDFTTNITAATLIVQTDELFVWSNEFRDLFSGLGTQQGAAHPNASNYSANLGAPQGYGIALDPSLPLTAIDLVAGGLTTAIVTGTPKVFLSDDVAHAALRQTFLARTHWKFTISSSPTPLYATWADGDMIANNPPDTV